MHHYHACFQAEYFVFKTEIKCLFCERSNKLKQRHSSEDSRSFQAGFSAVAGDKELIILCALYESVFTLATESFCDHVTSPGEFTDLFNKTAVWCLCKPSW